jgi:hypothetical protein
MPDMGQILLPQEFYVETPPYRAFPITHDNFVDVLRLQFYVGTVDTFCLECERESVFRSMAQPLHSTKVYSSGPAPSISVDALLDGKQKAGFPYGALPNAPPGPMYLAEMEEFVRGDRVFQMTFACTRDDRHRHYFFCRVRRAELSKVGQSPSLADIQKPGFKKYKKLLGSERHKELMRAIGLHAVDVGIGAFVYLRRIFESLIESAHGNARDMSGWDEDAFARGRMEDRILALQAYLPDFLVKNRQIYSILGLGVHELSEKQCLEIFPVLRTGIELILDEQLAQRESAEKTAATTNAVAAIKGRLATTRDENEGD